jgi:hypothetical protein
LLGTVIQLREGHGEVMRNMSGGVNMKSLKHPHSNGRGPLSTVLVIPEGGDGTDMVGELKVKVTPIQWRRLAER